MSEGRRSGVHWMRRNAPPTDVARARASNVLPVPGRSCRRTCPPDTRPVAASRTTLSLPTITRWTFSSIRPRSSAARRGTRTGSRSADDMSDQSSCAGGGPPSLGLADHPGNNLRQVRPALAERHRVHAVCEHHLGDLADLPWPHLLLAVVRGLGLRGTCAHEVGSV